MWRWNIDLISLTNFKSMWGALIYCSVNQIQVINSFKEKNILKIWDSHLTLPSELLQCRIISRTIDPNRLSATAYFSIILFLNTKLSQSCRNIAAGTAWCSINQSIPSTNYPKQLLSSIWFSVSRKTFLQRLMWPKNV